MFTKNVVKAAPVIDGQSKIAKNRIFNAVVVNSGNANCLTGKRGLEDCRKMAEVTGKRLGISADRVLVSSTGLIGQVMDLAPLNKGIGPLIRSLTHVGIDDAARAIMTTDRFPKISSRVVELSGEKVTITGVAKGAGMVKPEMATMLAYVMTDARISSVAMDKALKIATAASFNRITVDGDMSTNDTVMLMANGSSGNIKIPASGSNFRKFTDALSSICLELAEMIVRDGEGASKVIEVVVSSARTQKKANRIAQAVANSLLVKCAALGEDPNWGRVASSAGSAGEPFDTQKIEILLDGKSFYKKGMPVVVGKKVRDKVFSGDRVHIEMKLNEGNKSACFYSCDISKEYINLNAHYTT